MVAILFDRSQLFLDMRCAVFPLLRTARTHGIPHKNAPEQTPSRERFTFWGFRGPDRAIQPVSEARDYGGCQSCKEIRSGLTSRSGGDTPEWFRELTGDISES